MKYMIYSSASVCVKQQIEILDIKIKLNKKGDTSWAVFYLKSEKGTHIMTNKENNLHNRMVLSKPT